MVTRKTGGSQVKLKNKKRSGAAKKIVEGTSAALAAAAASHYGDPSAAHAVGWGASTLAPVIAGSFWDFLKPKWEAWRETRRQQCFEGFAGEQEHEARRLLEELSEKDWARDAIFATLRQLDEAVSDAVAATLGRLLKEYLTDGKQVDSYFRGVQRTLTDLTADEFDQLRVLLDYFFSAKLGNVDRFTSVWEQRTQDGPNLVFIMNYDNVSGQGLALPAAPRLFQLLASNGLAEPKTHVIIMQVPVMQRLAQLICIDVPLTEPTE